MRSCSAVKGFVLLLAAIAASVAASSPALAACSIDKLAELPVTMVGLRPKVVLGINGKDQVFLADSGAFYSVISPGTARDLGLKLGAAPNGLYMIGVGGTAAADVATVKAFTIAGVTLNNAQFIVGGSEPGTAGVLGQNLLGFADVEYDLPHGAIRLMRAKNCQNANLAYWVKPGDAFSMIDIESKQLGGSRTSGIVRINGVAIRAMFDTGAESTIVSLGAAARAGLKPDMPGARSGGSTNGFGRASIATWIVPVKMLAIGEEQVQNARIRIGDLGGTAEMLIGADFFISHRVFVSNAAHKLFLSYTGGPIFDLTAHFSGEGGVAASSGGSTTAGDGPLDAAAFGRRAAVEAAQHDDGPAIADLDRAIALAPGEPGYRIQRATVYLHGNRGALAAGDIDQAIELDGGNPEARLLRAQLRLAGNDDAGAIADLDAAAGVVGQSDDRRLAMALSYDDAGAFEKSIAQATLWIDRHPIDAKRSGALNARCWARAELDRDLPQALADCNAALRLRPRSEGILDSRGLVYLRSGDRDRALADYDAALAIEPRLASSLYGRSIIEAAKGDAAHAKADRDAAIAIDPDLPALADRIHLGG